MERDIRVELSDIAINQYSVEKPNPLYYSKSVDFDRKIVAAFDECHGRMLLLGEVGLGKTTALELLHKLLLKRIEGGDKRFPIMLNLESWASHQGRLEDWLVEAVSTDKRYQKIDAEIMSIWIKKNRIVLLLDDLDHIEAGVRKDCLDAISHFCEQSEISIVVGCRT